MPVNIFNYWVDNAINSLEFLLRFLPEMKQSDYSLLQMIGQIFPTFRGIVAWTNFWFPIDTLFLIIGLQLGFYAAVYTYSFYRYVLRTATGGLVK